MEKVFDVTDLSRVEALLRIDIKAGSDDGIEQQLNPTTALEVKPPLSVEDHAAIFNHLGADNVLGRELVGGVEETGKSLTFTVSGEPSEAHAWMGVELAKEIITQRRIGAALVVSCIRGETKQQLVKDATPRERGSDIQVALVH